MTCMTVPTKAQAFAIKAEVDGATLKLNAFIEKEAGFFASAVERDMASQAGVALITGIIQNAYMSGWADGAKAATAGKAMT